MIDINLNGTFNMMRLAAAAMQGLSPLAEQERGVIITTASVAAFEGQIGQVAYTAAKAGIAGMCLTMARDLGSLGIRVLAIAPSLFATGLTKGIPDEYATALTKDAAFPKRLGRPEEYAKLVAFMRRWHDVPPPNPPVEPSPKRLIFSQSINELREKTPEGDRPPWP